MFPSCRTLSPATQLEAFMHRPFHAVASVVTLLMTLAMSTSVTAALTADEIRCQKAIGHETARYAQRIHTEILQCNDDTVHERSCNTATRDAAIVRALSALNRTLLLKC